jgi:cytochrome c oxidase subunit 3
MALATRQDWELPTTVEDKGGMSMPVLGVVFFIASEMMLFAVFFGSYFTLRAGAAQWPPENIPELPMFLPIILTLILLTSSVSMHGAVWGIRNNNRTVFVTSLAITVLLGVAFLAGEIFDALELGFDFSTNAYGTVFLSILSFHILHVAGGVLMLIYCLAGGLSGKFGPNNYQVIESTSYYWHFVDVIWIFVFTILYVLK